MLSMTMDLATLSRLYGDVRYPNILFDAVKLPNGIDRDVFTDELYRNSCGLEVLYSDGRVMYNLLSSYSKRRLLSWQKMYDALKKEYEATENYDRYEDTKNTSNSNMTVNSNGESQTNGKNIDTSTGKTKVDGTDKSTQSNMAYDSGSLVKNAATESETADRITSGTNQSDSTSKTTSSDASDTLTNGNSTVTSHIHGNIGVTTNQQMIQSELELRLMDIIGIIVNEIVDNFCIKVY